MSRKSGVKRSLSQLRRDSTERQKDNLIRGSILEEERADDRAKRLKKKESSFVEKWEGYLKQWNAMNLLSSHNRVITLPDPTPMCTT